MENKKTNCPKSIGIIIDGNRRWARRQGLPTTKGHEIGYKKIKEFVRWAKEAGIATVYVYAFSTENWHRSKEEVAYLMKLFLRAFGQDAKELMAEKYRVKFVGQIKRFSLPLRTAIKSLEQATANFKNGNLVFCLSYGGRAEIVEAVKKIAADKTGPEIAKLTENEFSKYLWTAGLPYPELIIRTSGEVRTSNFLPWQSAYSEWFFVKACWPALSHQDFKRVLKEFSEREIRNGR